MPKKSDEFEKRIERIHKLIEDTGAEVTWNEKIPDPDNPKQSRQIDVTIRRENSFTIVECRFRKGRQDVTWIEELIGRRQSLKADGVIAVSDAGFTEGARKKEDSFGIMLREMRELSDDEISSWGLGTKFRIQYKVFRELKLNLLIRGPQDPKVDYQQLFQTFNALSFLRSLEEQAEQKFSFDESQVYQIECNLEFPESLFGKLQVEEGKLTAKLQFESREEICPYIATYENPELETSKQGVTVTESSRKQLEVISQGSQAAVLLDVSKFELPLNATAVEFFADLGRNVSGRISMTGTKGLEPVVGDIEFNLLFSEQN